MITRAAPSAKDRAYQILEMSLRGDEYPWPQRHLMHITSAIQAAERDAIQDCIDLITLMADEKTDSVAFVETRAGNRYLLSSDIITEIMAMRSDLTLDRP